MMKYIFCYQGIPLLPQGEKAALGEVCVFEFCTLSWTKSHAIEGKTEKRHWKYHRGVLLAFENTYAYIVPWPPSHPV
jgi:hypothetical protein